MLYVLGVIWCLAAIRYLYPVLLRIPTQGRESIPGWILMFTLLLYLVGGLFCLGRSLHWIITTPGLFL